MLVCIPNTQNMITLQELLDWLMKIPECSGTVWIGRDEFYGVNKSTLGETIKGVLMHQEHGYVARTNVKQATYSGRGMTVDEAVEALGKKLKSKFQV